MSFLKSPPVSTSSYPPTSLRTDIESQAALALAADVCAAIEVADHKSATRDFDDDEKGVHILHTPGGPQEMAVVTEPGLYRLIRQSRSPPALPPPDSPAAAA